MSRTEAKKRFTLEDHAKATEGVECRKDLDVIDETLAVFHRPRCPARTHADGEMIDDDNGRQAA